MNPFCAEGKNPRTKAICAALPVKRHQELLRLLRMGGQMTIREVANQFKVSVDTARRDLDLLASQGLLTRTYGGAVAIQKRGLEQMPSHLLEETRLARVLHQVIKDGETLLLNGGSATRCCAEELGSRDLKIVTNNLDISFDCVTVAHLYVLGGRCLLEARVTVGPMIVSGMTIAADSAVIGVNGITVKEGLTINSPEEALLTSEMIAAAQRTIVVADSSKFAKKSFARIGPIGSMQVLITDKTPPDDLAQALDEARVEVIIAPQEVVGWARSRHRFTNLSNEVEPAYKPLQAPNHHSNRQNNGAILAHGA